MGSHTMNRQRFDAVTGRAVVALRMKTVDRETENTNDVNISCTARSEFATRRAAARLPWIGPDIDGTKDSTLGFAMRSLTLSNLEMRGALFLCLLHKMLGALGPMLLAFKNVTGNNSAQVQISDTTRPVRALISSKRSL